METMKLELDIWYELWENVGSEGGPDPERHPSGKDRLGKNAGEQLAACQVRSNTDRPCPRPSTVEMWGIPFCEPCARKQRAYFAIGEVTESPGPYRKLEERVAEAGSTRRRWT